MFNKFAKYLDEKLSGPMGKLAEQRHLRAVRDGVIATLPMIIVSSMLLVIAFLPNQLPAEWGITQFIKANANNILLPYRVTMFIMTLYATFGIGYSLAKSYKLDGLSGGILSVIAFLLTIIPVCMPQMSDALTNAINVDSSLAVITSVADKWVLPMENLGSSGMFIGILCAFLAVEVYRFTTEKDFRIKMPPQVPEGVARSFEALTPTLIIILVMGTISMWLKIDLHTMIAKIISPLVQGADTLPSILVVIFLEMFFWSFGIHGSSIVYSLARPIWLQLLDINQVAVANGMAAPHVATEPFFQWFVQIGGSGATIGLAILFCFRAKSKYLKTLGKTAIVPGIFNINEPMIFGTPLLLNPTLILPFIGIPLLNGTIAYFFARAGLISNIVAIAPWTLPVPIGAFLSTGGDWRAAVLSIGLIVLSIVLYYPFFKMYDKEMVETENKGEQNNG